MMQILVRLNHGKTQKRRRYMHAEKSRISAKLHEATRTFREIPCTRLNACALATLANSKRAFVYNVDRHCVATSVLF